ncbi:MAG: AarF/ABC1/UbiB kinase family protein [Nanoarchaeota archaeon]
MAALFHEIKDLGRLEKVVSVLASVGMHDFLDSIRLKSRKLFNIQLGKKELHAHSTAEKLRIAFEKLGPTYIKFGQLLSVRPDLVSKEYIKEFSKLQDEIAPFDSDEAKSIVENELGRPIHQVFKSFSTKPLSAASIAQVHLAVLKNGQKVVVKVQRPRIKEIIEHDMHVLYHFAQLMEKYINNSQKYHPREAVSEFERWISKELDFFIEARNAEKMYLNFKNNSAVKIPKVYWEYSTKRVLTLEYLDGVKLKDLDVSEPAKKELLKNLVNAMLKQIVEDGFFHADPHPGNIIILKGNRVGLVDFGIVGNLDNELKENIATLLISITRKNIDGIMSAVLDLNTSDSEINIKKIRQEIREDLNIWYVRHAREYSVEDIVTLVKIAADNGVHTPIDFILLAKALLTLDGVCQSLVPDYYLIEEIEPYMKKLVDERGSLEYIKDKVKSRAEQTLRMADKLPGQLAVLLRKLEKGKIKLEIEPKELKEVEHIAVGLEVAAEKISLGVVIGALLIGAGLLSRVEGMPVLLGWPLSSILYTVSTVFAVWMVISILRGME